MQYVDYLNVRFKADTNAQRILEVKIFLTISYFRCTLLGAYWPSEVYCLWFLETIRYSCFVLSER